MTDHRALIVWEWSGEAMVPLPRFHNMVNATFTVGERYKMEAHEERSHASHNHEFAVIEQAWQSLPEQYANEPWAQTPEHLRKYALIRTKFCNTQTFPCGSHSEAKRWAANLRPLDEYSIVTVDGSMVYRFTAMSQSKRAMGAKVFQESKQAILEFIGDLIGVAPEAMGRAA
jgi:hypothetical protein